MARLGTIGGLDSGAGVGLGSLGFGLAYGLAPIRGMRLVTWANGWRKADFAGLEVGGVPDPARSSCVVRFSASTSSASGMGGCERLDDGTRG